MPWQIAGIFLTLATYNIKHKTLHYYVNIDAAFRKKIIYTICYSAIAWKSNRVEGLVAAFENNSYLLQCGGRKIFLMVLTMFLRRIASKLISIYKESNRVKFFLDLKIKRTNPRTNLCRYVNSKTFRI